MSASTMLDWALRYAELGWPVFPLHWPVKNGGCSCGAANCKSVGKHPRTENGNKDATCDVARVREMWSKWPLANIGVPTGIVFDALDVDPRHGGEESLGAIEKENGSLPSTFVQRTGSGGWHYLFTPTLSLRNKVSFLPGLDVRATGGHIVVSPSLHESGRRYEWEPGTGPFDGPELSAPPAWLLALFSAKKAKKSQKAGSVEGFTEGQRNDGLFRYACGLRRQGMSAAMIVAALQVLNEENCRPPLDLDEVATIANSASSYAEADSTPGEVRPDRGLGALLVKLAEEQGLELLSTDGGEAYGRVQVRDHFEVHRLDSGLFKGWLRHTGFQSLKRHFNDNVVSEAVQHLTAQALFGGTEKRSVYYRVAGDASRIWIDLGTDDWSVVEVTARGWEVLRDSPVLFRRSKTMKPLPVPVRGGSVLELREFVNVGSDEDFALVVAWLLMAFHPYGPYPVLVLTGEQDSAKSTTARHLKELSDPDKLGLRSLSVGDKDLKAAATNSRVLVFDNLSKLSPEASDSLCRLSTGGAISNRKNYSDDEEAFFEGKRPVVLTSIEQIVEKADLADRSIFPVLPALLGELKTEEEMARRFSAQSGRILGALLDAISQALRVPFVGRVPRGHRLVDFVKFVSAVEPALGLAAPFEPSYAANRSLAKHRLASSSVLATSVLEFMASRDVWQGSASELCEALRAKVGLLEERFIPSPRNIKSKLTALAPVLRSQGLTVREASRTATTRSIVLARECSNVVTSVIASSVGARLVPGNDDNDDNDRLPAHSHEDTEVF